MLISRSNENYVRWKIKTTYIIFDNLSDNKSVERVGGVCIRLLWTAVENCRKN